MSRRPFAPPARLDRDACGIGLVADAEGRASRSLTDAALTGLACVRHRGALAADGMSGDGAGILTAIPQGFFARVAAEAGMSVPEDAAGRLGVITAFLDAADDTALKTAQAAVADACATEGIDLLGWRDVPTDHALLGADARLSCPAFVQAILVRPSSIQPAEAERRAYRARRRAEAACTEAGVRHYFASWSFATVTYKALVMSDKLAPFYLDLQAPDFEVALAIFHSRTERLRPPPPAQASRWTGPGRAAPRTAGSRTTARPGGAGGKRSGRVGTWGPPPGSSEGPSSGGGARLAVNSARGCWGALRATQPTRTHERILQGPMDRAE